MMNESTEHDPLKHFDERAEVWDELYQRAQFRDRRKIFVDGIKARVPQGGKILDFGCGTGVIALDLAQAGYQVSGVDGAEGMIQQGRKTAKSLGLDVSFEHLNDPPNWVPVDKYDAIVCSSVIEYVPDDLGLVKKFSDGLVPGGWLRVSVPSATSWVGKLEDLVGQLKGANRDVQFAQRRYNLAEFKHSLSAMGLETEDITCFEFPVLGRLGVLLSRVPLIGVMALVTAQKNRD